MNEPEFPTALPESPDPATPPVAELVEHSAERKGMIQRRLGEAVAGRPPVPGRAARPAAPVRARNGIFDAPDPATQAVRQAAAGVRQRLAEVARAITQAESICPRHLAVLEQPGAAEIAMRTEDFDVEAAAKFLADASALLDSYKPAQG